MAQPWLKKNPWMSLWMSAAHRAAGTVRGLAAGTVRGLAAGTVRGLAAAQAQRQLQAAMTEATQGSIKLWSAASAPPATRNKATRKR